MYTTNGKQVLRNGEDFAQACDPGAAVLIADTLNDRGRWAAPVNYDDEPDVVSSFTIQVGGPPVRDLTEHVVGCRAYQASDQMICPCGLAWDVNDSDPPRCRA